jgi:transcriptional regulator with XRE-family HTH domain
MERKFRLNWIDMVHEAKLRRLKQRFTQAKLAKIAGVSTPTISRFENLDKDIQLSSVFSILGVLGLVDDRKLNFTSETVAYIPDRMVVLFWAEDGDRKIRCEISWEALCDHYNGDKRNSMQVFKENRFSIEHEIRRKYLANKFEKDGSIFIRSEDL